MRINIHSLRSNYKNFEEFDRWDKTCGISARLRYKNSKTAWENNPRFGVDLRDNKLYKLKKSDKRRVIFV